jgi:virginiamycin B lyase
MITMLPAAYRGAYMAHGTWSFSRALTSVVALVLAAASIAGAAAEGVTVETFDVPAGSRPHDVAPAADGGIWYTAQGSGELGWLDPVGGEVRHVHLGPGARPHGVIVGPDDAPWITDGGLNAILRVDPDTLAVDVFPLPAQFPNANLNTATFDHTGVLWFTGQSGVYGRLDPPHGVVEAWPAPGGRGPYGITTTPAGEVWYASLAGNHIAHIGSPPGTVSVVEPPHPAQGARRVWSDSRGRLWVSEWNSGHVSVYDPRDGTWEVWRLPGSNPQPYSVYVDDDDIVWLTDFGANAIVRFDPTSAEFTTFPSDRPRANVRQMLGRPGEVWGAESGADRLIVIRSR